MAAAKATYSPKERERIISHVLTELAGGRAVSRVLREDENMCPKSTFWNWCFTDEELMGKVTRAREHGADSIMDETVEIADDGTNDWIEKTRDDGSKYEALNGEHVQRSKLRIDTRHKYAQMIAPRKYGPKLDLTSGGEKIGLAAELDEARTRAAAGLGDVDKT